MTKYSWFACIASCLASSAIEAQGVLQSWSLPGISSPNALGDVDGDGVTDVGVLAGSLDVYSGRTGTLLQRLFPPPPYLWFSSIGRIGDVDGDGRAELVYAMTNATIGEVRVVSGASWAAIYNFSVPPVRGFVGLDDVNNDGRADFALGYPDAAAGSIPNAGRIDVIDGATGNVLRSHFGTWANQQLKIEDYGHIGDLDGDGTEDLTTTDASYTTRIFSGSTGQILHTANYPNFPYGVGDINADGFADFGVGVDYGWASESWLRAGPNGALLWHHFFVFNAPGAVNFFGPIGPAGDADGDGYGDVLMGGGAAQYAGPGFQWCVMSGRDHSLLINPDFNTIGAALARIGDVNGDGVPDVLTDDYVGGPLPWVLRIVSGIAPGVASLGAGCPDATNTVPVIGVGRGARLGETMTVNLSDANPGLSAAFLALGFSDQLWNSTPLPAPLAPYGLPGCNLHVAPDVTLWLPTAGNPGMRHNAQYALPVPNANGLLGLDLFAQWLVLEQPSPGLFAGATTRGMRMRVVP